MLGNCSHLHTYLHDDCIAHIQPPLHAALSGFTLSNGVMELKFDDSNKLVGWAGGNDSHSIQHSYMQYVEKKGDVLERSINVCDGTNVYTFVPDDGRNTLSPKVGRTLDFGHKTKPEGDRQCAWTINHILQDRTSLHYMPQIQPNFG